MMIRYNPLDHTNSIFFYIYYFNKENNARLIALTSSMQKIIVMLI